MEKNGRVEIGKTPDAVTGKPAVKIENGEPVSDKNASAPITDRDVAKAAANKTQKG